MEEAPAFVDTLLQQVNTLSPLCRCWTIVMAKNVPANEPEPWAVMNSLDDDQRILVEELLAKHYNALLQGGKLSANDIRVDLFDGNAGLSTWDLTRVPAWKICKHTRIRVQLERGDQVWCKPDASLACKTLERFTRETSISGAQLRAEFEAFKDEYLKAFRVHPEEALVDGFHTDGDLCAPATSFDDDAGHRSRAATRSHAASSGHGSSVGPNLVALNKQQLAAQRAKFQEDKTKEKKRTTAFLEEWKLTLEDVLAHGDCQFLTVAQQLALLRRIRDDAFTLISPEEREELAMTLRTAAVDCMKQNEDHFSFFCGEPEGKGNALDGDGDKDFGRYLKRMVLQGQYGDECTLAALALKLDLSIQVFAWDSTLDEIRITRHSSNPTLNPPTNGGKPNADNVRATQGTVNIFHFVYQNGGAGHYKSIMETEVKRSMHA